MQHKSRRTVRNVSSTHSVRHAAAILDADYHHKSHPELSDSQLNALAHELDTLYSDTQANMGQADLDYIAHVKDYSLAIKKCSDALFQSKQNITQSYKTGVVLRGLHKLLEFSIGHVILHGAFDHLYDDDSGEFHSSNYQWQFAADTTAWKTMHHQNHHPFTNIKGLDHDLGYGLLRISESQNWWGHHLIQPFVVAAIMGSHSAYFSLYTSYSAGAINKKPWYKPRTYKRGFEVLKAEWLDSYVREPLKSTFAKNQQTKGVFDKVKSPLNALFHASGNFLGHVFGYNYLILLLLLEHHSHNATIYEPQKRSETKGEYYHRQIMATTNFIPNTRLDLYLQSVLTDVDFPNPPTFRVFYEALDTHLEHHLFPDLPGNRLREISPKVKEILTRYGLPYHLIALDETLPDMFSRLGTRAIPVAHKNERLRDLIKMPRQLVSRLLHGTSYRTPPTPFYLGKLREDLTPVQVLKSTPEINDNARTFTLALPPHWQNMTWAAGAFISIQVSIAGKNQIRQYSLTHANQPKQGIQSNTLTFTVKRVENGLVSNYLNDHIKQGDTLTLFRKPQGEAGFVMDVAKYQKANRNTPRKTLFLAAGVGITPIISMIRALQASDTATDAQLLYFNRHPDSVIFHNDIKTLHDTGAVSASLYFSPSKAQANNIKQAYISKALLTQDVPDLHERDVYICAPAGFIDKTKGYLRELNYDMANFHMEMFQPPELAQDPEASYRYHQVTFAKSGKTISINENTTLLAAAQKAGVSVLTGCEKGLCKACVCPKLSGETSLDVTQGKLEKVTVCNAMPLSDVVLNI